MSRGARGVRLNPSHDDRARAKIKTSQIINRLNAFVLRELDPTSDKPVEMSKSEVTAAVALLKKTLPDLTVVEGAMMHQHVAVNELPDEMLANIAAGRSARITQEAGGAEEPDSIH